MQVLCIETVKNTDIQEKVIKGNVYSSIVVKPIGLIYRNLDMWHYLKELKPETHAHVSLFVELPNQEGVVFSKKEELVETI